MQKLQRQCSTDWCVTAQVNLAQNHPAVAFATNWCTLLTHTNGDIYFTYRRPYYDGSRGACCVVYYATRREVCHHRPGPVTQYDPGRQRQRIVLADGAALLGYQRQPVHVGIDGKPYRRTASEHEPFQIAEVFGHGFRGTRKAAIGLEIDRHDLAPQPLQERGHDDRPRPANAVQSHLEAPRPNALHIQVGDAEHSLQMALNRTLILRHD